MSFTPTVIALLFTTINNRNWSGLPILELKNWINAIIPVGESYTVVVQDDRNSYQNALLDMNIIEYDVGIDSLKRLLTNSLRKYVIVVCFSFEFWKQLVESNLLHIVLHRRELVVDQTGNSNDNTIPMNWKSFIGGRWDIQRINDPFQLEDDDNWYIETVYNRYRLPSETPLFPILPSHPQRLRNVENPEEEQYCDQARRILATGTIKGDRTGTGTLSVVGAEMRFDLSNNSMPLLTTRKLALRLPCIEEQWMLRGQTDAKLLDEQKITVWNDNTSRAFLDKRGLFDQPEGSIGAGYGFQIRHWGAKWIDCHTDYTGQGIDQLQLVINQLRANPNDRRMLINCWNVADIDKMALPSCHYSMQFLVEDNKLSIVFTMRSSDFVLGCPSNIAQYALFVRWMAAFLHFEPGQVIYHAADVHVYLNQLDGLCQQLQREPRPFAKVTLNRIAETVDSFEWKDCNITDYNPYPSIKFKMAI